MNITAHEIAAEVVKLLEERGTFAQIFEKTGAANYLRVSVSTLENLLHEIPHSKVGRKLVFMRTDLDLYIRSKRCKTSLKDEVEQLIDSLCKVSRRKETKTC